MEPKLKGNQNRNVTNSTNSTISSTTKHCFRRNLGSPTSLPLLLSAVSSSSFCVVVLSSSFSVAVSSSLAVGVVGRLQLGGLERLGLGVSWFFFVC